MYEEIISIENLLRAWRFFRRGKTRKADVLRFEFNLENNIFKLHTELLSGTYKPEPYVSFYVEDPKLRHIHKATVRDRVLHQAIFSVLYRVFDEYFIFDSYSSRNFKGTHAGNERVEVFLCKATANWTRQAWVLKCDVRKFFDSIDHSVLLRLIQHRVASNSQTRFAPKEFRSRTNMSCVRTMNLVEIIVKSFEKGVGKGLPLGNVTSQLFANVYMNEFDQFAKHTLKAKWYARYCDDFVIVDRDKETLESYIPKIRQFLLERLGLELHPNKVSIRKVRQGIDFLGYVILPHRKVLRTKTKKRIFIKLRKNFNPKSIASYKGVFSHGNNRREIDSMNILINTKKVLKPRA